MKIAIIDREFFHIFIISSFLHKKPGFHPLFRRYIFRKTAGGGGQIDPPSLPPAVLGLIFC